MHYDSRRLIRFRESYLLSFGPPRVEQLPLFEMAEAQRVLTVKRHHARSLHTDYRFSVYDTLVSFVSSELPSLDPRRPIRLREMRDHDPAYANSERRIPDGFYGAGAMLVWDLPTIVPLCGKGPASEVTLEALLKGRFDFFLDGKRLKGGFRLEVRGTNWWLIKLDDEYATTELVVWDEGSILTGKTLEEIEREYQGRFYGC